jgi:hypothetical protein
MRFRRRGNRLRVARKAVSPEGYEWKVRRRWVTSRPRARVIDFGRRIPFFAGFVLIAVQLAYSLVFCLRLAWRLAIDLHGHLLRGRPWIVEARLKAQREHLLLWRVHGWHESRAAVDETVRALKRGETLTRHGEGEPHG